MGLFTGDTHVHRTERVVENVTHKHETAPEVIRKMHEWQRELVSDWVEQQIPGNSIFDCKCWRRPLTNDYLVAFKLNNHPFEFVVSDFELTTLDSLHAAAIVEVFSRSILTSIAAERGRAK